MTINLAAPESETPIPCPPCYGTGKILGGTCLICDGTGVGVRICDTKREADLERRLSLAQSRIAALEKDWETDADYIRMAERIKELEKVASKFVERHDEIEPALRDVFTFYAIHGMKWPEDKNWKRELDALRDTLKSRA